MEKKHRLITRNDFDGMACCILLKKLDLIDDILFVHPREMQHGRVEIKENDISANLPYVPGIYMAFDHHISEKKRVKQKWANFICQAQAPSAARVLFDYFKMGEMFPGVFDELLEAVDKADLANFSREEILNPTGWTLFNFIIDPKTGFSRFHDFKTSHNDLILKLINEWDNLNIDKIMALPEMQERILLYHTYQDYFKKQIKRCAMVFKNLVIVDFRGEELIYPGNRFMVYALYPDCDLSLFIQKENGEDKYTFSAGKSILKKTCPLNVGDLMLKYNGGGHIGAGTCQSDDGDVEQVKMDLIGDILTHYQEG